MRVAAGSDCAGLGLGAAGIVAAAAASAAAFAFAMNGAGLIFSGWLLPFAGKKSENKADMALEVGALLAVLAGTCSALGD